MSILNLFKHSPSQERKDYDSNLLVKQFQHFNIEIHGTIEDPLFKANDIGNLLGIEKIRKTIENLDDQTNGF